MAPTSSTIAKPAPTFARPQIPPSKDQVTLASSTSAEPPRMPKAMADHLARRSSNTAPFYQSKPGVTTRLDSRPTAKQHQNTQSEPHGANSLEFAKLLSPEALTHQPKVPHSVAGQQKRFRAFDNTLMPISSRDHVRPTLRQTASMENADGFPPEVPATGREASLASSPTAVKMLQAEFRATFEPQNATPRTKHHSSYQVSRNSTKRSKPRIDMSRLDSMSTLKLSFSDPPPDWGTYNVWRALKPFGTLVRIAFLRNSANVSQGYVIFRPPPVELDWMHDVLAWDDRYGNSHHLQFWPDIKPPFQHQSPVDPTRMFPEELTLRLARLDVGVLQHQSKMLIMRSISQRSGSFPTITLNLLRKDLEIKFELEYPTQASVKPKPCDYLKLIVRFSEMSRMLQVCEKTGEVSIVLPLDSPPFVYRKTDDIGATHDAKGTLWDEKQAYFRQTEISETRDSNLKFTALRKKGSIVDVGRWLSYRFVLGEQVAQSDVFNQARQALLDHNVKVSESQSFSFVNGCGEDFWWWLSQNERIDQKSRQLTGLGHLHELANCPTYLEWQVRYMLEVCISQNIFHESTITKEFLERLAAMMPVDATRLLEKAVDCKLCIYNPADVFIMQGSVKSYKKKVPHHCSRVCAVTVTPTTMYFAAPTPETSNRIVREYRQYEDRFLRVKFTDEKYRGAIQSVDDRTHDEVFDRVSTTMTNGIMVGDRHFEFLAYGNSQFREHGAYFFASTPDLTADGIRRRMGSFDHIRVVAKYAARLGQCFSTTRAMPIGVRIERLSDVVRNNYTFTDGVGKISAFLAQMIAEEFGMGNSQIEYPSVVQFRLGGCKGVLAVDPVLKGNVVQIRPSQEKFTAAYHGLEICRLSQFSAAALNMQLILVLEALGVPDAVFVKKMREALERVDAAMDDERTAIVELSKNVDMNQTSLTLAHIIREGFMEALDPFTISCLQLWRAWTIKYLKEKAKIFVEKGAFVLGCVDETSILRGHFENVGAHDYGVPEIFLQISDPENKGRYKIVEGLCILARNPSLHPGDVRVVKAVDVPALHHLRNCVVLPQTGDRDLANMCSGGDLDGDDYLVMWDPELLPSEWNHEAQNYEAPAPVTSDGPVSVQDIVTFFVSHMKHSNLKRIAVAHRYWADAEIESVKADKCIRLAALHSMAVDYAKTGVPAEFPKELRVTRWPHWSERKGVSKKNIYQSKKVLGQVYDIVNRVPFKPDWKQPFDDRVLTAFDLADDVLVAAREIKKSYDEDVCRIMAQHGIKSEFEVWTTWILEHNQDSNDYKLAESFGEIVNSLKQRYQSLCYERAGTTARERDWEKLGPFIAAMYRVTAEEIASANSECAEIEIVDGEEVHKRVAVPESMPLMSFPWLFPTELGQIANSRKPSQATFSWNTCATKKAPTRPNTKSSMTDPKLEPLPEITLADMVVHGGEELNLFQHEEEDWRLKNGWSPHSLADCEPFSLTSEPLDTFSNAPVDISAQFGVDHSSATVDEVKQQTMDDDHESESDTGTVHVVLNMKNGPSALDRLNKLLGL